MKRRINSIVIWKKVKNMPKNIAIICEYNPFHNGHAYQITKIREDNPDSVIVAIMSGNITQRGEFALFDKSTRAKVALMCGADAVFEMPYPYCGSVAEIFASAGVEIANSLGCDTLCFGVEERSMAELNQIADVIMSNEMESALKNALENKEISYVAAKELALKRLGVELPRMSNDMLALEYILAIRTKKYSITPMPIKRNGAGYKDTGVSEMMSATAIRAQLYQSGIVSSVPSIAKEVYLNEISNGRYLDVDKMQGLMWQHTLLNGSSSIENAYDAPFGISYNLVEKAKKSTTGKEFFDSLASKSLTASRAKRILLYSLFGINEVDKKPKFTILLSSNERGKALIKSSKAKEGFCVITKPSDSKKLDPVSKKQLEACYRVDEIYNTLLTKTVYPNFAYTKKPYIK